MRRLQILNITPSSDSVIPSTIEVQSDFSSIFHGKEWIDQNSARYPYYTYDTDPATAASPAPVGTTLLIATTFDIVDNAKYAGRYTVYTTPLAGGLASSEYNIVSDKTTIRVNEVMPTGSGVDLTSGFVTHISTYMLTVIGESSLVVLEQSSDTTRPVEFVGRMSMGWGEVVMQNLLRQAQSFAGPTPPVNAFQGQLWFDTSTGLLKIKPTAGLANDWTPINSSLVSVQPYRHTQTTAASTWTISHGLDLPAPYYAGCDFFLNTPTGVKPTLPGAVSFIDGNTMTVTFSNPETGFVIVRQ